MMKRRLTRALTLLLAVAMLLSLFCACAGDPGPGVDPGQKEEPGEEPGPGPGPGPGPAPEPVYGNADPIDGTGADESALLAPVYAEEGDGAMSADDFVSALLAGTLPGGAVTVTDPIVIDADGVTADGKGTTVWAAGGITFSGCTSLSLADLLIDGTVSITNSESVTFTRVAFRAAETAVTSDRLSASLTFDTCAFDGRVAFANAASGTALRACRAVYTDAGLADTGKSGTVVYGSRFTGTGTAIATAATGAIIRRNTVAGETLDAGVGIAVTGDTAHFVMTDALVAENRVTDVAVGLSLSGNRNTSAVRNSLPSVVVDGCHSVYVCDNAIGACLTAKNSDYLLADGNAYPNDGWPHAAVVEGLTNETGDTVQDVNARPACGADDRLLPHVDKDLFVGAELKRTTPTDDGRDSGIEIYPYINREAGQDGDDIVIIAPGKYANSAKDIRMNTEAHSHTTIYAYGVYAETQSGYGRAILTNGVDDVVFKGLIVAFKGQSCGQVYILEKRKMGSILATTGAGMINDFGGTGNKLMTTTSVGAQHPGTYYAWCDTSAILSKQDDGVTMTGSMSSGSSQSSVLAGEVLTCRLDGGSTTVSVQHSADIVFRDVTIYGNAGGFAFTEGYNRTGTTYYRVLDTTRTGEIIDKETYDRYKAWEEQYGVDLEISIDEQGRYRGSPAHIGSIDATHTTRCAQGAQATFCLFENMCDDGTNQNHMHARLGGFTVDETAGTVDILYRGNLSEFSYGQGTTSAGGLCADFSVGDRVYIYTSSGCLVCDGPALTATSGEKASGYHVTVSLDDFHVEALETKAKTGGRYIDHMMDPSYEATYKILVDNMSRASGFFFFDNCLVQNIRSRGLLIKASDSWIRNCTFRNIGMSAIAILYEIYWGESGVTENLDVRNNIIDHTGYFQNIDRYAPIAVEGLGARAEDEYLPYKNLSFVGNRILNRTTTYAFFINSARDVLIQDNYVGMMQGEEEAIAGGKAPYSMIAHILAAKDVEFTGNVYEIYEKEYVDDIIPLFYVDRGDNIYGRDVEDEDGWSLLD